MVNVAKQLFTCTLATHNTEYEQHDELMLQQCYTKKVY